MTRPSTYLSRWAELPVMAMRHREGRLPMAISSPTIFAVLSLVLTWTVATVLLPRYKAVIASHIGNARQQLPSVNIDWSPNDDPRKNYNASKIALIIESEPLPVLVPLILHMIAVVPPDWRFVFIGSKKSVFTVGREFGIQLQQGLGKIDIMTLPSTWPISTDEDRNRLLTDTRFYEEFLPGAEWLLMFNHESLLCANSEVSLNDWLDWSWAGAARPDDSTFAGYGGLSIRRVSAIQRVLSFQKRLNDSDTEDKWFGKRLSILPNAKVANATDPPFAVENSIRPNPMGYYAPGRGRGLDKKYWKLQKTRQEALKYCPELHIILDMKLEKERCPNDNRMGLAILHQWFDKKKGVVFGIAATGSSIGGVVFPILVTRLIERHGFSWSMRICAFMILGLLIIANLTIKALTLPQPKQVSVGALVKPFRETEFIFLMLGFFCFTYGIFVPINYLPVQALQAGVDPNIVQYLIPILNAASLFGRVGSGLVGDKIGRYNIFVIVCYLSAIWVLALWIPCNTQAGIIAFSALFGFSSGAYISLVAPLAAQISPLPDIGFRTGIVFFVSSIGGLTTNPINGAIVDKSHGWLGLKLFSGVFCVVGTTFILIARIHRVGWKVNVVF